MRRWERRLKDLAMSLESCGASYFDPERFRLNSNHFLTTARTVSFLFQKDKASIENFEAWHRENIYDPWHADKIMKWSIVSRNTIEKEGDLDLYSTINATLIFSYIEEQDQVISMDSRLFLGASIKRLTRFARSKLPSGVSDVAAIRVDRRWIANTLPDIELLHAFQYIYARMFEACTSLGNHLGVTLESSIPAPTSFDEISTGSRGVHYIPLNSARVRTLVAHRQAFNRTFSPPEWAQKLHEEREKSPPNSLATLVSFHEKMAYANFMAYGNHLAMLWLYDEKFKAIDFISTAPVDQVDKFIFWRTIGDRIHYLKARYLIWVSEAWLRQGVDKEMKTPTRNLPIIGEFLQVVGIDGDDQRITVTWDIRRKSKESSPTLERRPQTESDHQETVNYLIPARRALAKAHVSQAANV